MIEKKKLAVKDMFDWGDYVKVATESSEFNKAIEMQHWQFRHWKSGKSAAKVKKAKVPAIVTFTTVMVKKGQRCLYYNTELDAPLKKLDFLSRNYNLVPAKRHQKPRGLNQEKYEAIMTNLVPAMPKEKQVCSLTA